MTDATAKAWAILFARLVLGLIFFMAGVWKVFVLGPAGHVHRFFLPFQHTFLPVWSLWAVGFTIPFVELIAGALVILGLKTRYALVALGVVLAIVSFGHLLDQPLYALYEHVIPRLVLVVFVLVMPQELDQFSMDQFLKRRG
ncbi:MAG: DoxX family protein [Thermoanaerobaculia bacterium]